MFGRIKSYAYFCNLIIEERPYFYFLCEIGLLTTRQHVLKLAKYMLFLSLTDSNYKQFAM